MTDSPYYAIPAPGPARLLFLCDHAGREIPETLNKLGLDRGDFMTHIASDLGAGALTERLAARFAAPAILGRWSRLLADLNRGEDDPTVVMRLSDGRIIPGNASLSPEEIAQRIALYHAPYHAAIKAKLDESMAAGLVPVLVSMHSFTPVWRGKPRPWHIGKIGRAHV